VSVGRKETRDAERERSMFDKERKRGREKKKNQSHALAQDYHVERERGETGGKRASL